MNAEPAKHVPAKAPEIGSEGPNMKDFGRRARTVCALVLEESPSISTILQDRGWKAVRHSPCHINTGTTATIGRDIKQGVYDMLWIEMPLRGRHIAKDRMHSALHQLCRWLLLASEANVPAGVFGAFGSSWKHEAFHALTSKQGFGKSYHRACHFNLKLDPKQEQPSKICFVFLANPRTESHQCKCNVSQVQHKMDWTTSDAIAARRPRMQLQQTIAKEVIKQRISTAYPVTNHKLHYDTPDCIPLVRPKIGFSEINSASAECTSCHLLMPADQHRCLMCESPLDHKRQESSQSFTSVPSHHNSPPDVPQVIQSFPTEARIKQKERLKARKEAGVKPKTRAVRVEPTFDDCGNDTSFLLNFLTPMSLWQHPQSPWQRSLP